MDTTTKQHYERNAAKGRRVRFSISLNFAHCTEEDRAKMRSTGLSSYKISGGTMRAEDAAEIMAILLRDP